MSLAQNLKPVAGADDEPPSAANFATLFMIGENRAIAPVRR